MNSVFTPIHELFINMHEKYGYSVKDCSMLFNQASSQELKNLYRFYKTLWSMFLHNEFRKTQMQSDKFDEFRKTYTQFTYSLLQLLDIPNKHIDQIRWIMFKEINHFATSKSKQERDFIIWGFKEFFKHYKLIFCYTN